MNVYIEIPPEITLFASPSKFKMWALSTTTSFKPKRLFPTKHGPLLLTYYLPAATIFSSS